MEYMKKLFNYIKKVFNWFSIKENLIKIILWLMIIILYKVTMFGIKIKVGFDYRGMNVHLGNSGVSSDRLKVELRNDYGRPFEIKNQLVNDYGPFEIKNQ